MELLGKRSVGVLELAAGRSRRFRQSRLPEVIAAVEAAQPDHVIITGDLTTLALLDEFHAAREILAPLLKGPHHVTILPGNHDRYTRWATRHRFMEKAFGPYMPDCEMQPLKWLDPRTALIALDPSRPGLSAQGWVPPEQFQAAQRAFAEQDRSGMRWLFACHYPLAAPGHLQRQLRSKGLKNGHTLAHWLRDTDRIHLYLCGHVHAVWAFRPPHIPNQLSLNPGPPTHVHHGEGPGPGFFLIDLAENGTLRATHRGWVGHQWVDREMVCEPGFFQA